MMRLEESEKGRDALQRALMRCKEEQEKRSERSSSTAAQLEATLAEDEVSMRTEHFHTELTMQGAPKPQEEQSIEDEGERK